MTRLILPGYQGSPVGHWQRHWLDLDVTARMVEQEDFDAPELEAWLIALARAVAESPGAVLIAHSLGTALVAHFAARYPDAPIGGALLVAPADVDRISRRGGPFGSFAPLPRRPLPFASVLVASRNDPYMEFKRAAALAADWGSGFVDLGNAGHINIDSGFGPWTEGFYLAGGLGQGATTLPFALAA